MNRKFWENLIFVAIILVVIQTFVEDYAVYAGWDVSIRHILVYSGLVFDIIFSIEFIARSIVASREDSVLNYWRYRRGWVDFLSSIPLLLLNSGPAVYLLLFGGNMELAAGVGVLNILKVVKAVRVTRILRLVRLLKVFGKIHNAESAMAQYHTATISTTAVFSVIIVLMGFSIFTTNPLTVQTEERIAHYSQLLEHGSILSSQSKKNGPDVFEILLEDDPRILVAGFGDTIFMKKSERPYQEYLTTDEFVRIESGSAYVIVSIADLHAAQAFTNMEYFVLIVSIVLGIMVFYTRYFVQSISDIAHILNLGFRKKDYNLQVKLNKNYANHEIFRLAKFYNDAYLPAKLRKQDSSVSGKSLSMNDLMDFGRKK